MRLRAKGNTLLTLRRAETERYYNAQADHSRTYVRSDIMIALAKEIPLPGGSD